MKRLLAVIVLVIALPLLDASKLDASSEGTLRTSPVREKMGDHFTWDRLPPFNDFGDAQPKLDATGLRHIRTAPPTFVHPRIFFGPDDLRELRARIHTTHAGREAWLNLLAWTAALKGTYDRNAAYAQPINNSPRVPLQRLGPQGVVWRKLQAGDLTIGPNYANQLVALEAFRALIDNDADGAHAAITAAQTLIRAAQAKRETLTVAEDREHPFGPAAEVNASLAVAETYDFLYNFMTVPQRDFFRAEIARGTDYHGYYGAFHTPYATTSNWTALDSDMIVQLLAIEGEPGYNALKFGSMARAYRNFLTYGWYPDGNSFEGQGKNAQFDTTLVLFEMRGIHLAALPAVRAYGTQLLFSILQPYRNSFFGYDLWGGTDRPFEARGIPNDDRYAHGRWFPAIQDPVGLKYLFPNDERIDWVYRNAVGTDYSRIAPRADGLNDALLDTLLYAQDFQQKNNDPAKLAQGTLAYFDGFGGEMVARSDWSTDAVFLAMHTRQDEGGHTSADRNGILLAGAGRIWGSLPNHNSESYQNSLVTFDGQTQDSRAFGRVVAYSDSPRATFMTGDASWAWNWQLDRHYGRKYTARAAEALAVPPGEFRVTETPNDFFFTKVHARYATLPFYQRADQLRPFTVEALLKKPNHPVRMALRTAGVVRGKHPFVLVRDAFVVDGAAHDYQWLLQVPADVAIARAKGDDIVLSGGNDPRRRDATHTPALGEPLLLVRILRRHDTGPPPTQRAILSFGTYAKNDITAEEALVADVPLKSIAKTLVLPAHAIAPDYVVLLFPFHNGTPMPQTQWNASHTTLTVTWARDQTTLELPPATANRALISLRRTSHI